MTKDIPPNYSAKNVESIIDSHPINKRNNIDLKKKQSNAKCRSRAKTKSTSSNSQNINPNPDESYDLDLSMESNVENNNNLSDVASTCSNLSFPSFSTGSYVMASWKNNFEYLAEVLGHRKRQGDQVEYKLKYIWDKVIEWSPSSKLREAAEFEIDFVLNLCKQQQSIPLDGSEPERPKGKFMGNKVLKEEKEPSPPPATGGKAKKPKKAENGEDVSIGVNDMVYDKSVAQFHEACKRRRMLKRNLPEETPMNKSMPIEMTAAKPESGLASAKKTKPTLNKSFDCAKSPLASTYPTNNNGTGGKPTNPVASSPITTPKPPIRNYQCPYCPRQLRQEKLLRAHIQNYHENDESYEAKVPCAQSHGNNSSYYQKQLNSSNRSVENSFSFKTVELKGYVNCASCRQSFVSLKLDPGLYLQCNVCLTWSHRKCIGISSSASYPFEKYNSMKLFNSKWSCLQCTETLKTNPNLFKYDWMSNNYLNPDRLNSNHPHESTGLGNICQNGIPLTPPSTPPIPYESGSMVLPSSLDVLRNGKSVLSTYRKKVLSDSASLLNYGHTIHRLFPAIAKTLVEMKNSTKGGTPVKTAVSYQGDNFLGLECAPSHQLSTNVEDDNNFNWMDFRVLENMAVDVLSTNNPGQTTAPSKQTNQNSDHSGGLFSLELVPSEVLKDLLHSDSAMPDDINEFLGSANANHSNVNSHNTSSHGNPLIETDYGLLNLTPTKMGVGGSQSRTSGLHIDENSMPPRGSVYPEQSPNSIASILKSSMHQDNPLSSPVKGRDLSSDLLGQAILKSPPSKLTPGGLICDTNPDSQSPLQQNQTNLVSTSIHPHHSQPPPPQTESFPESMAFYNSVFEKLTSVGPDDEDETSHLHGEFVDIEDAANCLVSMGTNGKNNNKAIGQKMIPPDNVAGNPNGTSNISSQQVEQDLKSMWTMQVNPLVRLLDKFEESLKKMSQHVDNLEVAYKEDMLQQTMSMNNDNIYSKSCGDMMSYSSRLDDYTKMDCAASSSDDDLDSNIAPNQGSGIRQGGRTTNLPTDTKQTIHSSSETSSTTSSSIYNSLHHFDYFYVLKKSSFPNSTFSEQTNRRRQIKLYSRLYSLQMAKRDSVYNKKYGFNQVHNTMNSSSSLGGGNTIGGGHHQSASSVASSHVLKNQNRNPSTLKKTDPAVGPGVVGVRNRCLSSISPLVSTNVNNQNNNSSSVSGSNNGPRSSYLQLKRTYPNNSYHQQYTNNYRRNIV